MSCKPVLSVNNLSKTFKLYKNPIDRLLENFGLSRRHTPSFEALSNVSFTLEKGTVFGVVGKNGAGKSTLLQLICGVLQPTSGSVAVHGRIAALLELGSGFNPEFTGRENIYLNATLMGLSKQEINDKLAHIIEFSELESSIDLPVKTYSSGMFVRLAFSIATSIEPDILIIDEALSVGDGAFAKKSFDRIMQLKDEGVTILFCSHSLYQIEALCSHAIWLHKGRVSALGDAKVVMTAYQNFLNHLDHQLPSSTSKTSTSSLSVQNIQLSGGNTAHHHNTYRSELDNLTVSLEINNPNHQSVVVAIAIHQITGYCVCSFSSHIDHVSVNNTKTIMLELPQLPLLKGDYYLDVFLMCDKAIHVYEHISRAALFNVIQSHLEVGVVHIPRIWHVS